MTFRKPKHDLSPLDRLPVISSLEVEPSSRRADQKIPASDTDRDGIVVSNPPICVPSDPESESLTTTAPSDLSRHEERLLITVVQHPNQRAGQYPKLARMNAARTVTARQSLVQRGLVREYELAAKPKGRPARIVALTPLGESIAQALIQRGASS